MFCPAVWTTFDITWPSTGTINSISQAQARYPTISSITGQRWLHQWRSRERTRWLIVPTWYVRKIFRNLEPLHLHSHFTQPIGATRPQNLAIHRPLLRRGHTNGCLLISLRILQIATFAEFAFLANPCHLPASLSSSCYVNGNPAPLPLNFWLLVKEHFLKLVKPLCH